MTHPLHHIAHAMGTPLGGPTDCAVCGPAAPFAIGRPAKRVFGPAFTDYALVHGGSADVCAGCAGILGGKPGSDPPPLRMSSFAVIDGGLERCGMDRVAELLRMAEPVEALGWAVTRQKHASLRCGPCSGELYRIGCDHGTIDWTRDHIPLLDAVATLRTAARQEQILHGSYPPHVIQALGARWQTAEDVVARHRPSLHLDMVVAVVRRPEHTEEPIPMTIPPEYQQTAELLAPICQHSAWRREDPFGFWAELLPRRLESAASSATVLEWVSSLVRDLRVAAYHPEVVAVLSMDVDDAQILPILRRDSRLLITLVRQLREDTA